MSSAAQRKRQHERAVRRLGLFHPMAQRELSLDQQKYCSCVLQVSAKGKVDNPWAVCARVKHDSTDCLPHYDWKNLTETQKRWLAKYRHLTLEELEQKYFKSVVKVYFIDRLSPKQKAALASRYSRWVSKARKLEQEALAAKHYAKSQFFTELMNAKYGKGRPRAIPVEA